MATSSFFKEFVITDDESRDRFLKSLDNPVEVKLKKHDIDGLMRISREGLKKAIEENKIPDFKISNS